MSSKDQFEHPPIERAEILQAEMLRILEYIAAEPVPPAWADLLEALSKKLHAQRMLSRYQEPWPPLQ
jgi:hypothetical protein